MRQIRYIQNKNIEFEWVDNTGFSKLNNITQICGIIFNSNKEIMIINTSGNWALPGGTPEKKETPKQTLKREALEEADIEIEKIIPIGYQIFNIPKKNIKGSQLRFVAKIKKIFPQTIDPSNNKMPKRKFISTKEFLKYLHWGK